MYFKLEISIFKVIVSSFFATIVSLMITIAIGRFIPVPIDVADSDVVTLNKDRVYSIEELEQAERTMQEEMKQYKEQRKKKGFIELIRELKIRSFWINWIPWFLLPFVLTMRSYSSVLVLIWFPLIMMFTGLVIPIEIGVYLLSMCLGIYLRSRKISSDTINSEH